MNDIPITGSESFSYGFIDSGTTFTYLPDKLWRSFDSYFNCYCLQDEKHCLGKPIGNLCFDYDPKVHDLEDYFASFPILKFMIGREGSESWEFKWFPSEYLYREAEHKYCIAAEKYYRPNEILMGGTFMRQHNFIFDVGRQKLGIARSQCNIDDNWVENEKIMRNKGYSFGFRAGDEEILKACTHRDVSDTLLEIQNKTMKGENSGATASSGKLSTEEWQRIINIVVAVTGVFFLISCCIACYMCLFKRDKFMVDETAVEMGEIQDKR